MQLSFAILTICAIFVVVKATAGEDQRTVTWSVEGGELPVTLTLSEDGQANVMSGGVLIDTRSYTAEQTENAFYSAQTLLAILPELLTGNTHPAKKSSSLRKLGVLQQSTEITTRLALRNGPIEGSITVSNLPALVAILKNEELAQKLRITNEIFGGLLSQQ